MGSRQPFLFAGTGFGGVYRNVAHFQIKVFLGGVMLLAVVAAVGLRLSGRRRYLSCLSEKDSAEVGAGKIGRIRSRNIRRP